MTVHTISMRRKKKNPQPLDAEADLEEGKDLDLKPEYKRAIDALLSMDRQTVQRVLLGNNRRREP